MTRVTSGFTDFRETSNLVEMKNDIRVTSTNGMFDLTTRSDKQINLIEHAAPIENRILKDALKKENDDR